jgi:hypothetical protein
MADRYWVGGTGNWTSSGTGNWSASSGGASGASAPTQTDAAIFDGSSGGGTVTLNGAVCQSFTCTGSTCTFTGVGSFNVHGSVTLASGGTYTGMYISVNADCTFTSAGKTISNLTTNTGVTLTCADALSCASLGMTGDGTTVLLKEGVTSSITSIVTPEEAPNMAYLRSASDGNQATLSDTTGTNTLTYITVKDIAFTGGAAWNLGEGSVNDGNTTGIFAIDSGVVPVLFAQSLA